MSSLSKTLEDLHSTLAHELLKRIKQGESTPALLNVARQFLRDNGIEGLPAPDSALAELMKVLPDMKDEDALCADNPIYRH